MIKKYNHLSFLSVDEQIEIREAIYNFKPKLDYEHRDKEVLELYFIDGLSARDIEKLNKINGFSPSGSKQERTISARTVNNIVNKYFPNLMKKRRKPESYKTYCRKKTNRETTKIKRDFNPQMCCRCGTFGDVDLHHMIPSDFGGISEPMNLMPLCEKCHSEFTDWLKKNKNRMILNMIQNNWELIKKIMEE